MTTLSPLKFKSRLKTMILLASLTVMLTSALTSFFLVRNNESKIAEFKSELQNKQNLIRDVWDTISRNESKANIAVLLSSLTESSNTKIAKIIDYYLADFTQLSHTSSALEILTVVAKENQSNIDYINTLYLEQVSVQNKITDKERSNRLYAAIAFFLQVLGLALIILEKNTALD